VLENLHGRGNGLQCADSRCCSGFLAGSQVLSADLRGRSVWESLGRDARTAGLSLGMGSHGRDGAGRCGSRLSDRRKIGKCVQRGVGQLRRPAPRRVVVRTYQGNRVVVHLDREILTSGLLLGYGAAGSSGASLTTIYGLGGCLRARICGLLAVPGLVCAAGGRVGGCGTLLGGLRAGRRRRRGWPGWLSRRRYRL
jgi:hypothetical protein